MTSTIKDRIKIACYRNGVQLSAIALKMNMSPSVLSQRLNKGKFTTKELNDIAEVIGCKYNCYFTFGSKNVFKADSMGQQIKDALSFAGMTIEELASKMDVTRSAVAQRLSRGKYRQDEIEKIAGYIGCEYVSEFEFEDGTVI